MKLKILCGGTGILRVRDHKKGLTERKPDFDKDQVSALFAIESFMAKYGLNSIVIWTDDFYAVERRSRFELIKGVAMTRWERLNAQFKKLLSIFK